MTPDIKLPPLPDSTQHGDDSFILYLLIQEAKRNYLREKKRLAEAGACWSRLDAAITRADIWEGVLSAVFIYSDGRYGADSADLNLTYSFGPAPA